MLNDDVYILDIYTTLYIWIGNKSNKFERNGARKKAQEYLDTIADGRNKSQVEIAEVDSGHEPAFFTVQFPSWSPTLAQEWLEEDQLLKLKLANPTVELDKVEEHKSSEFEGFLDPIENKFPYLELKGAFPTGVRGNKKEYYLDTAEFEEVFKMTLSVYNALKDWKKQDLKKKVGLF